MKKFLGLVLLIGSFAAHAQSVVFSAPTTVSVTSTSALVFPPNGKRNYLILSNTGSAAVIIKFGSVQSANEGLTIPAGGNYEPNKAAANAIYAKTATGSSTLVIVEGQNSP